MMPGLLHAIITVPLLFCVTSVFAKDYYIGTDDAGNTQWSLKAVLSGRALFPETNER